MSNCGDIQNNMEIRNINRSIKLMKEAIQFNNLNLKEKIIFTEAASGEFIYTPIIAALAGAKKVYAIVKDSQYASKEAVKRDTMKLADICNVKDVVEVVYDKEKIGEADIVTNLGFVRPIDKATISMMKKNAVISYMCEAWEVRDGDVDIKYCTEKNIKVMGTNENYKGLDVFNYSGPLAIKMLFDAGIEIYKCKIVIVSGDKFGQVIYDQLVKFTSDVTIIDDIYEEDNEKIKDADAIIIADYTSDKCFIGEENSSISIKKLKEISPHVSIIQFAGLVDCDAIKKNNVCVYPNYQVGSYRMGKTLAYLGPKPIIDLHCAGLKVGQLMVEGSYNNCELCQEIL